MASFSERPAPQTTNRFEIRRRIGQGAVGVVYEAFDREHDRLVALKSLRKFSPETLLSLKNEFRAVQDLYHPNLVRIGELLEADGAWLFTMELIHGADFIAHVRTRAQPLTQHGTPISSKLARSAFKFDEYRLRNALSQLITGIHALHAAGKIHRDLKPSNVLVSTEGRVVILDFGLASDMLREKSDGLIVGSATYMAPEQVEAVAIGPAADWYAIGVMLFEALTGRPPFVGAPEQILEQKLTDEAMPPAQLVAGIPEDLNQLCVELLRFDPAARPTGEQIVERFGIRQTANVAAPKRRDVFVGRQPELAALEAAYQETKNKRASTLLVQGESGVGKSFLVSRFLEQLEEREPRALILAGRCYERESVPFKAFDGIIDKLSQYLGTLTETEVAELVPPASELLLRAFPILESVSTVVERTSAVDISNPQEMRSRVFASLRELFWRLAERQPLVLAIDDLQWTDEDSLALLAEVLRPPLAPPLLLIGTVRVASERTYANASDATEPTDAALLRQIPGIVRHLQLNRLPDDDACELAAQLLDEGGDKEVVSEQIRALVGDAKGHPLFIDELVRQRLAGHAGSALRLDDALWDRVTRLEDATRRVLELLAASGMPVTLEVAAQASAIDFGQLFEIVTELRAAGFVRMTGASRTDKLETYHDRIRESVLSHLAPRVRQQWHRRLAAVLEVDRAGDPEAVAVHWQGAGEMQRAAHYFEVAAEQAISSLAFERAARLLRLALSIYVQPQDNERKLKYRLADALSNAGQGAAAAEVCLELARESTPAEALELRRRAAEQLLCAGHFERGFGLVRDVLRADHIYYPTSRFALLLSLLVVRVLIWIRGVSFRERDAKEVDPALLRRVDSTFCAAVGFSMSDNIRGAYFQTRNLLLALRAGDPHRVSRSLGLEVCFQSTPGTPSRERAAELLAAERKLAERVGTPEALALASGVAGCAAYMQCEWRKAKGDLARAEILFRDQCVGVTFTLNTGRLMLYRVLARLGQLRELARRVPPIVREAQQRNDLNALINYQTGPAALLALAEGRPGDAQTVLSEAASQLPPDVFHVQHYFAVMGQCEIDLYRGDPSAAYARLRSVRLALTRSLLLRIQSIRIYWFEMRARVAASVAITLARKDPAQAKALVRRAEKDARRLEKEDVAWAQAAALSIRGVISAMRNDDAAASTQLASAARTYDSAGMQLYAAAARRVQGIILGGAEGIELIQAADDRFRREGIVDPERMTAVFAVSVEDML